MVAMQRKVLNYLYVWLKKTDDHMMGIPNKSVVASKLVVALLVMSVLVSCGTSAAVSQRVLFKSDIADSIPYRIPTIAAMYNGDLLALSDYRICGNDIGYGRVDIHARVSRN
jgi:hypothetical protein